MWLCTDPARMARAGANPHALHADKRGMEWAGPPGSGEVEDDSGGDQWMNDDFDERATQQQEADAARNLAVRRPTPEQWLAWT